MKHGGRSFSMFYRQWIIKLTVYTRTGVAFIKSNDTCLPGHLSGLFCNLYTTAEGIAIAWEFTRRYNDRAESRTVSGGFSVIDAFVHACISAYQSVGYFACRRFVPLVVSICGRQTDGRPGR